MPIGLYVKVDLVVFLLTTDIVGNEALDAVMPWTLLSYEKNNDALLAVGCRYLGKVLDLCWHGALSRTTKTISVSSANTSNNFLLKAGAIRFHKLSHEHNVDHGLEITPLS